MSSGIGRDSEMPAEDEMDLRDVLTVLLGAATLSDLVVLRLRLL